MREVWRDIKGYEGIYQVSNKGKIKVVNPRYKDKVFLKPSEGLCGFYYVWLYKGKKRKNHKIHRLVAATFINNPCDFFFVVHKDGNKKNNSAENLKWVSNIKKVREELK